MTLVLILFFLTVIQFFTGFGIITLCRLKLKPGLLVSLSVLLGVAVFSIIPFVLQLLYIPLTKSTIFGSLMAACIALNFKFDSGFNALKTSLKESRFTVRLYEIPALVIIIIIVGISVWKCFYLPPTPRDLTSGPEVIAEYAIQEKTMINSLFSVNLETTNNPFKSPYITSLQVIYKYAGFPFGQLWLSAVFVSFLVFLYNALGMVIHKLPAGILIVFFLAIPEMFAYTFMVLYDYSNAVYFFLSLFFLFEFLKNRQTNWLALAGLLMAIATYIRSETLVLACMMLPLIAWQFLNGKREFKLLIQSVLLFILPAVVMYVLSVPVFINNYLPAQYNIAGLINKDIFNLSPFFNRFKLVNDKLIFSSAGVAYYGYFIFIFLGLLFLEIVFKRNLTTTARNWLYAVMIVYTGYPLLGYLLPLLDIDNSTKRGFFKLFPLMLLYMANNSLVKGLSEKVSKWETQKK